jgi:hypothetical protein
MTLECKLAYNRGEHMEERTRLFRNWSAYLDAVSNVVVPIRAGN